MHPGVTVENSKSQKDELIVQGKGTFRYYVNALTGEATWVLATFKFTSDRVLRKLILK